MSNDNKTLADVQPGGRVRLGDQAEQARFEACAHAQSYRGGNILTDRDVDHPDLYADPLAQLAWKIWQAAVSAQPSPGGQGDALKALDDLAAFCSDDTETVDRHVAVIRAALAARRPVGLSDTFQHGVSEWMDKCFLPSLYSDMTERGDRLLEEVLELLQAHGYDKARVPTLVDYVFSRPVGDPAQEVGGVMVTLAGYCWVAGLDMHVHGHAELARISHPEVMAKIRAKQEAKNALHFDTPLPGNAARQPVGEPVAYLDLGAGGYMDVGTDLSDEELAVLPKGRHMLGIIGTYGVDGYKPAQAVDLGQFRPAVELMEWQERGHANPDFPRGDAKKHAEALRLLALIDSRTVQTTQAVDLDDFKALYRAYVRLLESGRDRIRDLGGACDPVDVMEANDVDLQAARRVIDSQAVGNG